MRDPTCAIAFLRNLALTPQQTALKRRAKADASVAKSDKLTAFGY
jgi:hypothetical protein